jgi:hypothetical protein
MSDGEPKRRSERESELEREIRRERKFSMAEAIGRLAGPGAMKGASPVGRTRQAEAEIGEYLRSATAEGCDCLGAVLLRQVVASELLLANLDRPLVVLAGYVQGVMGSEYRLRELVRETDVEWGRAYDERPYFDREGTPPNPDDPYTVESVRGKLSDLMEKLAATLAAGGGCGPAARGRP